MVKISNAKRILASVFILAIGLFAIKSNAWLNMEKLMAYIAQNVDDETITLGGIESEYVDSMWEKQTFINVNGLMANTLNMQGYYSDMGMYVTDENYIVSAYAETSTDYEYEQIVSFKEYLDSIGVNLVYVNAPTKYVDDAWFSEQFGKSTYTNKNADLFLQRIENAGISVIDLRDEMENDGLNVSEQFFRTDHHWTPECGLWATQIIAEGLNDYCDYNIDTSIYDKSNFTFTEYKECWLGEQGRKVAATYVGLDDYTVVRPNFETSYLFKTTEGLVEGTFDDFIDESVYNLENDVYENKSWHYSYAQRNCINNNVDYGKVLLLGDSYSQVVEPYLSLGVSEIDSLILRQHGDGFDLRTHIKNCGYDTIVICYAQFMIGAHDNPESANYRMFTFY